VLPFRLSDQPLRTEKIRVLRLIESDDGK
jgi:hypothetical protein